MTQNGHGRTAVPYDRVSTGRRAETGYSVRRQVGRRWCETGGYEATVAVSGAAYDRIDRQKLGKQAAQPRALSKREE